MSSSTNDLQESTTSDPAVGGTARAARLLDDDLLPSPLSHFRGTSSAPSNHNACCLSAISMPIFVKGARQPRGGTTLP